MNKGETFVSEVLTKDEISDLMEELANEVGPRVTEMSIARNLAAFVLMYRAGLRRKEVSDLLVSDIDFENRVVHVRRGKGGKQRRVSMDPMAFGYVDSWIKLRGRQDGWLFVGFPKNGAVGEKRVHESYWNKMMDRLAEKTGIGKRCNPHSLRHTMANELRQEGVDMWQIMKQLGHSDIKTTERYLDHLTPIELINTMQGREW